MVRLMLGALRDFHNSGICGTNPLRRPARRRAYAVKMRRGSVDSRLTLTDNAPQWAGRVARGMVTLGEPRPTVLVLGAGFTRAFVPGSPLLTGDFGGSKLTEDLQNLPHAKQVLDASMGSRADGKMDIEQLMTRLDGLMPYDRRHGAESELALLLTKLKANFVQCITDARDATFHDDDMALLARCCVENSISCVTFNYDDAFDQALWEVNRLERIPPPQAQYWHPDGGYGFFCRTSAGVIHDRELIMDKTSMLLLKLHGSVNWRSKLGSRQPYNIDDILHYESWMPHIARLRESEKLRIKRHLNSEPFIVPPVLVKSSLVEEPVLQFMWSLAYEELEKAERVIFVGYSFPVTDLAARFLFSETLLRDKGGPDIRVVNLKSAEDEREAVRRNYREVFPEIAESQFDFQGARNWSREFVATVSGSEPKSS